MAMVLVASVERFSNTLQEFLDDNVAQQLQVKDKLMKLYMNLEKIKTVLEDAEKRRMQDSAVNHWITELKDFMYEAEYLFDICRTEVQKLKDEEPKSTKPVCFKFLNCFAIDSSTRAPLHHEIVKRIEGFNNRIEEIYNDKLIQKLEVAKLDGPRTGLLPSQSSPSIESELVGNDIEFAIQKILEQLAQETKYSCQLFAISGEGGVGKTTLAQKIFDEPWIGIMFQVRIWVCVSRNFSSTNVLKQILKEIGIKCDHAKTELELWPMVRDALTGKSFFLVLDDVWNAEIWDNFLREPLQQIGIANGSILVTTRDEKIAQTMGATFTENMKLLPEKISWELLYKKAGIVTDDDKLKLEDIGTKIVKRCRGLPLAVKAVGSLLATKDKSRDEWTKVLDSNAWSMVEIPEEFRGALYLSYEDLPSHLKQFFLYLSLFPEDYEFSMLDISFLLVAEGFVEKNSNIWHEDTACQYFNDLMRRSLLQPGRKTSHSTGFVIHDVLHSLAKFLSQDECFFGDIQNLRSRKEGKLRRLSIAEKGQIAALPDTIVHQKCLRSLILLKSPPRFNNEQVADLSRLRVLLLNGPGIVNLPSSIGNLIHLTYLDMSYSMVSELPDSLGNLSNLQVLNLQSCERLRFLPRGIIQLFSLRCLNLLATPVSSIPKGIGRLQYLSYLNGFVVGEDASMTGNSSSRQQSCDLEELQMLQQLRLLRLEKLERAHSSSSVLDNKPYLKSLFLICSSPTQSTRQQSSTEVQINRTEKIVNELMPPKSLENLHIHNLFCRGFPNWLTSSSLARSFPSLTSLELWWCVSCTSLPPLGQLPQLKSLSIKGLSAVVTVGHEFLLVDRNHDRTPIFPKLELLKIEEMPNWQTWSLKKGLTSLMPCLQKVSLKNCPKLEALPEGLQMVTTVQLLEVEGVHNLQAIENIHSLKLHLTNNRYLERISNLISSQELHIENCPGLRSVLDIVNMKFLQLKDNSMESLPQWLLGLVQQRQQQLPKDELTLIIMCNIKVLERCLRGHADWSIIQEFPSASIYANSENGKAKFLHYDKPFGYQCNLHI